MSTQTKTLKVVGEHRINCGGCESSITSNLKALSGVQQVSASRDTQLVEVTFDTQIVTVDAIRQTLDTVGYKTEAV